MSDEMIIDMNAFNFDDIIDYEDDNTPAAPRSPRVPRGSNDAGNDTGFDLGMLDGDEEFDEEFDGEYEDEEQDDAPRDLHSVISEVANEFDSIDDEFEFTIGGEKIAKRDIAEVVRTRAEMKEAYEGLSGYVNNLSETEMRINTYLQASMTETETRLRQVEQMLQRPEAMTPSEVQKALVAKRDLTARQSQLEANAAQIRGAEEERRQQLDIMKIRQTDATLKTSVPGYKGIQTMKEISTWAQKEGISEADIRASMSPAMMKMMMDAKLYREKVGGKKTIREAAAKRTNTAPKSAPAKQRSRVANATSNAKAYERAMKSGDAATAFLFVE